MRTDGKTNLWRKSARETAGYSALSGDCEADLIVIGGGFTGCAAALEATAQGAKVVLLEAETIGHGGSGRNVGLVNAGLWLPPDEILKTLGDEHGSRLIAELSAGPGMVFGLVEDHGIDCEPVRNGTLHLAHAASGLHDLESRFEQGKRYGAPLELLDREETARRTGSPRFHGALWDPRAGTINPLAYCRGLARAALEKGASIHEGSPAGSIERDDGGWKVTANGHAVRAKRMLLATNAYHGGATGAAAPRYVPVSYSQYATEPLPEHLRARILPGREGCWDTAMIMTSFRLDVAGRIIIGGIGNSAGPGGMIHDSWAARKLKWLFPELAGPQFEHAWSGQIAMTSDHVPKVMPLGPDALAVFGYSGRGIAPGTVLGKRAAEVLLGANPAGLPLPVVDNHDESFTGIKGAWYEFGAIATHAVNPNPFQA